MSPHTSVVHCVAQISTTSNLLVKRFSSLLSRTVTSPSTLVITIFYESSQVIYSFTGYNYMHGQYHPRTFSDQLLQSIRNICYTYGSHTTCEEYIKELSCY